MRTELTDLTKSPPEPYTLVGYITELGGTGTVRIRGHNLSEAVIKSAVEEDIRKRGAGAGLLGGVVKL
jgi:hypothetical protein